jgi:ATP-dependent RNA helicase HrpB
MLPPAAASLPIVACLDELRAALGGAGHAVLQAAPGAGKTTAVPLAIVDEAWLGGHTIVMLEPRRLATRAAARRMAGLLRQPVGETVGYRTRDDRRVGPATRIEVVTEGILTRRLQRDPGLEGVGLVIFDEFHERSLQADLGLALALDARRHLRPDLRVLVMSATLDGDRIAGLLTVPGGDPAPVITGETRSHAIDVRWAPRQPREHLEPAMVTAIRRALRETAATDAEGDVLAFLPGAAEILRTADQLGAALGHDAAVDVHPLFGVLPAAEQDAALAPGLPGRRKVVLATDIAETSLTVEGVRVVVDAGLARRPVFDAATGLTRLATVPASRASADQRAGRAGRLGPGVAVRLWSKVEHAARPRFDEPEIRQGDLAGLALELAVWGTEPGDLPFLDPPPPRALDEARRLLADLGALDEDGLPTGAGREMVALPLHPRLARMLLAARDRGQGWLGCLLAALLEDRDVLRGRPDDVPADVGLRVALLADPTFRHSAEADRASEAPGPSGPARSAESGKHSVEARAARSEAARAGSTVDGRALRSTRDRAHDLARRLGVAAGGGDPAEAGPLLGVAYPDRIAQARGGPGRFVLRAGTEGWLSADDALAREPFLAVAEVDGRRRNGRIRIAAPLDAAQLDEIAADRIDEHARLVWDPRRDQLVARVERRLGRLRLGTVERRPRAGTPTTTALIDRVRATNLAALPWTHAARSLQARIGFLHALLGDPWPDVSDAALRRRLDDWLAPVLAAAGATRRADLERVDLIRALRGMVPAEVVGDLDRLAPAAVTVPSGRRVPLDYGSGAGDPPVLAVRVQEMFGTRETPTVAGGRLPVALHLLSPAGRPVQVTSDLAGFWSGSWSEVRKEMAGRYPKHDWPDDPAATVSRRRT